MTRVWDRCVRVLHAVLIASTTLAALSLIDALGIARWHRPAGYVALAAVLLRLAWSAVGTRHARFRGVVRGLRITMRYAAMLMRGREPRHLGHNPLGAWMMVALMVAIACLALTGWLYTTDMFFGSETVEDIHTALAWLLALLVALHVVGVLFTSWRHRENLPRAMLDGMKREAATDDIA